MAVGSIEWKAKGVASGGLGVFTTGRGIPGLTVTELPPLPAPLEPHQVVLQMTAACLNHRDEFTIMATEGYVPCSDGVGNVIRAGSAVTRVAVGDRVCPIFTQNWADEAAMPRGAWSVGAKGFPGTLCQLMLLSEDNVVKVPSHLTDAEAATLPCAGVTAWNGLVTEGKFQSGETLLIEGTGGVSVFGLQFAKALGGKVIATSSSDSKLERARALGADHVINYVATPKWGSEAKRRFGGADHVLEIGGSGTFQQALAALNEHGSMALIGLLAGMDVKINVVQFFSKRLRMNGIAVGNRANFEAMNRLIDEKKLRPVVDATYSLADVQKAFTLMHEAKHFGNIVVTIPPVSRM